MKSVDELMALLNAKRHTEPGDAEDDLRAPTLDRRLTRAEDLLSIPNAAEFVRRAFHFILKRQPEDEALRYYTALIENGQKDRPTILIDLLNSDEGKRQGAAILGLSSLETLVAGLAREQIRQAEMLERVLAELKMLSMQVQRLPQGQRAMLEIIEQRLSEVGK